MLLVPAATAFRASADKAFPNNNNYVSAVASAVPVTVSSGLSEVASSSSKGLDSQFAKPLTNQVLRQFAGGGRISLSHEKLLFDAKDICGKSQQGRTIRPLARCILTYTKGQCNA
jgi:hypothetical protein